MIKVGILGTGFGKQHAELYKNIDGFEVAAVFGRNEDKLSEMRNEFKVRTTSDIKDVLNDPAIDLIDICLPTELHAEWAIEGMKNNKHIFCETPLSYSAADAERIKEASIKYNKHVFVDMFIKFSTPHQTAISYVKSGVLGKLYSVRSYNKTSPRWGDLSVIKNIETFHIHNIDFICEIMGMPESAAVTAVDFDKKSIVTSVLQYKNNYAVLESNSCMPDCYPFGIGFELVFENGTICCDSVYGEFSREEFVVFENNKQREVLSLDIKDDYEEAFKHVLHCLENDTKSEIIDIDHAIRTVRTKEMILGSFERV